MCGGELVFSASFVGHIVSLSDIHGFMVCVISLIHKLLELWLISTTQMKVVVLGTWPLAPIEAGPGSSFLLVQAGPVLKGFRSSLPVLPALPNRLATLHLLVQ